MAQNQKIIVIVGPTASGKSDLAVMIARDMHGEVISADSRQVYRGLDIGTGKITTKEMKRVPHHLLDVASPKKQYSVSEYQRDANLAIKKIVSHKKIPIVCGGTGFYIDALIYNEKLPDVKPNDALRKKLETRSNDELYEMLRKLDPQRAETIDRHNPRRLVRAIEIAHALGTVPERSFDSQYDPLFIGIDVSPEILRKRIHSRLQKRIKAGMLSEVSHLHKKGLSWRRMEELGLEYRYLSRYLRGMIKKEDMLAELEQEIVNYAKRQRTWFKRNKNTHWVSINTQEEVFDIINDFIKNPAH